MTGTMTCLACREAIASPHDAIVDPHLMAPFHTSCWRSSPSFQLEGEPHEQFELALVATRLFRHFKGGSYFVTRVLPDASALAAEKPAWMRFVVEYRQACSSVPHVRPIAEFLGVVHTSAGMARRFVPMAAVVLRRATPVAGVVAEYEKLGPILLVQCQVCLTIYSRMTPSLQAGCPHCGHDDYVWLNREGGNPMFEADFKKGMNEKLDDDRLEKTLAAGDAAPKRDDEEEDEQLAES